MVFKSIRFKITIVYMAIMALTLSLFSVVLYHYVNRSLDENMDTLLRSKGEDIVHAINTYWTTEKLSSMRYGVSKKELVENGSLELATIAQRWVQEKSKDPKLLDIIIQIFDANGYPVASSKNTQGITNVSGKNLVSVLQGNSSFDVLTSSFPTKRSVRFRVYITPAIQNDKVEYIVQVASPLTSIQMALNSLKITLLVLFPITVLLTGVMGALLAKLTLHPVDNIIRTIHDITAENMKLKIAVPETRDEIQNLAETFNDMLARLDNAFTSQKQLFEDLSHQLKTPLTILKGEFEVVLKKMRSPEEYGEVLKSSLEEIDKISKLAENLLMLASFESEKIMPERKELELNLLIQGVTNNIKKLTQHKEIQVALVKPNRISVLGDEQQLKQLFLNLLDNAVKYTPAGGRIDVSAEEEDGKAVIRITDTGVGIPQEEIAHIFDRFYRVGKHGSGKGFGLGLSIVKSIVEAHKGKIRAESRPGQGSTFIVSLPLAHS